MRFDGTLKTWNDERGFGFIEPAQGGQEIFVHIKAFPSGTGRPSVGQALTFEVELGPNGKKRAHSIELGRARSRAPKPRRGDAPAHWTLPRRLVLPVFGAICFYAATRWAVQPFVWILYGVASLLAFGAYAVDKSAAVRGQWRISESTLHLFGLVGGWPGALLAQQWLRHKSSKPSFVATFWVTVGLNTGAFVVWHAGLL